MRIVTENKTKRKGFVEELLRHQSSNLSICFIGETNYSIHVSRTEGRSLKGSRCTTLAAGAKGANIYVIRCMSNSDLIHYKIKRGAFGAEQACQWMRNCLKAKKQKIKGPILLVIDSAPLLFKLTSCL